jgi:catechol 2,3-dioxygenase-like lactoylglutathione lyase family enzyme
MLGNATFVGFLPVRSLDSAQEFYCGTLGLPLVERTPFAVVVEAGGSSLRLTEVSDLQPQRFTVAGWQVGDISSTVASLTSMGVTMARFEGMDQDDQGLWVAPNGARVAWFTDPDGNVLSITMASS